MSSYTLPAGVGTGSVSQFGTAGSSYTVALDSYLVVQDGFGLDLSGGPWTVTINGGVSALDSNGLFLEAPALSNAANSKVAIGTEGSLYGAIYGLVTGAALDLTNSGVVRGDSDGVRYDSQNFVSNLLSTKKISVNNKPGATISGAANGIINYSLAAITVTNAGTISADNGYAIQSYGLATVTNSKLLHGDVGLFGQATVNTQGQPTNGNTVTNTGEIDGSVLVDTGKSTITNSGTIQGNDQLLDFTDSGQRYVQLSVGLAQGSSTIKNSGEMFGTILGSTGADAVTNTGTIVGDQDYGYDANTGDYFPGALSLGAGNDSLTNSKEIDGAVWLGAGDNTAINSGSIYGFIAGGDGNDKITNSGIIYSIELDNGAGGNVITFYGVDLGDGTNTLTNSKIIYDGVYGGDGGNTITNSGTIYGDVQTGAGNDKFTDSGAGLVTGDIYLGAGNDTFIGGASAEYVHDQAGNDTYSLGGGNDFYYASSDEGTDKVDGGAGIDTFAVDPGTTDPLDINLSTTTALGIDPTTAIFGLANGSEKVTGFEIVQGTGLDDEIVGGAWAETLYGNGGNDTIVGGGGADTLWGGAGNDTFVLLGPKDSGTTRATSDTIMDFTQGEDTIDITKIDANTTVPGFQSFHDLIANGNFNGSAGELRYIYEGGQTILQGDTNGDKKADFQITLQGTIALNPSDIQGLTPTA